MVVNDKTMGFRHSFKSGVVVGAVPAGVLYMMNVTVVVDHLMEQCGTGFLYRSGNCSSSNVDLMGAAQRRDPGILSKGEVTISSWGALDGDGRS